jgi:hypothetical protein
MTNNQRIDHFLDFVKSQCKKLNVTFRLSHSEGVNNGDGTSRGLGIFIAPLSFDGLSADGSLRVAIKNRKKTEWIVDVAHEYVHMMQWFRDDPLFEDYQAGSITYAKLEAATEKEAIRILKEWGIHIGPHAISRSKRYIAKLRLEERKQTA